MGGSPSNARVALFELMRAVNEREAAVGMTETEFFKADGTEAANLVVGDLENIRVTGEDSFAFQNLSRIRVAIIALIATGLFVEQDTWSDVWTKASMETEIGIDLDSDPQRPQDAQFWQGIKDAIDRLCYIKVTKTMVPYSGLDIATRGYATVGGSGRWASAWDHREDEDFSGNNAVPQSGFYVVQPFSGDAYGLVRSGVVGARYETASYVGVISESYYHYQASFGSYIGPDFDALIGTETFIVTTNDVGYRLTSDISIGVDTYIDAELVTTPPGTLPFESGGSPSGGSVSVAILDIVIFIDLASVLTDQA